MPNQEARLREALADRYALVRELGQGGMATVYLAEDRKHTRKVAIKILRPELAQALGPDRFLREIEIAARLNHPNVLTLIDSGEADGFLYFVMPYVEGDTLRAKLQREGRLPVLEAVRMIKEIVDALAYAHRQGVVHRDVKPDNVMLIEGHAVVTDFGVAKALSAATGRHEVTTAGVTLGTPTYMAPEQAVADPGIDHRADLYAVGVIAYEILCGEPPFTGGAAQEVLSSHVLQPPQPLSERREALPPPLVQVVMRCLEKKPADRFQTAEELHDALDRVVTPSGTIAVTGLARGARNLPRWVWGVVAAGVAVIAALLVWPAVSGDTAGDGAVSDRVVAVFPFSVRGSAEVAYLGEGMVNLLSTKLDGAGDLRSVDARALLSYAAREGGISDPQSARRIAREFGAGVFVIGDVFEAGGRLQISAALYGGEANAPPVDEASVEGDAADVFGLVDRLTADLLGGLGGPGMRLRQLASLSTASLPALKAYLECESQYRQGLYQPAIASCRRAIAEDSAYALAYYRLSVVAELGLLSDVAQTAAEQAYQRSSRLADRDRQMVAALRAWRRGEHELAERLYRSLVASNPDDIEALHQLGEVLFHSNPLHGRSFSASRESFERVLFYEPEHTVPIVHLARIAAADRRFAAMDSLVGRFTELNPEGDRELEMLALQTFARDDTTGRGDVLRQLDLASGGTLGLAAWDVIVWAQDIRGAEDVTRLLAAPSRSAEERSAALIWLAHMSLAQGKWQEAQEHLRAADAFNSVLVLEYRALLASLPFVPSSSDELRAIRDAVAALDPDTIPPSTNPSVFYRVEPWAHEVMRLYLLGLVQARLGETTAATRAADELAALALPPTTGSLAEDLASGVRAQAALAAADTAQALEILEGIERRIWYLETLSQSMSSQALERFMLAELLYATGREEDALGWYAHIDEIAPYEIVYRPWAHLRQAEILEARGDPDAAAEHRARFETMWRDADPELQRGAAASRE